MAVTAHDFGLKNRWITFFSNNLYSLKQGIYHFLVNVRRYTGARG